MLKRIWKRVRAFFQSLSLREWVLFGLVLFLAVACVQIQLTNKAKIITVSEQTEIYKNKANEEYLSKTVLLKEVKELKESNDSLYREYLKIKSEKPLIITKTVTKTVYDSIKVPTVIEKDSVGSGFSLNWNYSEIFDKNNYLDIKGCSLADTAENKAQTTIERLEVGSDIILDVVEGNSENSVRVIARSNNPRVSFTNIEGAVLDPTKNTLIKRCFPTKHWGLGVSVGYGMGFDADTKKISVGPEITIGLTYNILTW